MRKRGGVSQSADEKKGMGGGVSQSADEKEGRDGTEGG